MERLILDTGAVVALERESAPKADLFNDDDDVAISVVTASELLVGVELADGTHRTRRVEFVEGVITNAEVIPFDLGVARHHAALLGHTRRLGQPRGAHDLQIAATALATARIVTTTDASAFQNLPGVSFRLMA